MIKNKHMLNKIENILVSIMFCVFLFGTGVFVQTKVSLHQISELIVVSAFTEFEIIFQSFYDVIYNNFMSIINVLLIVAVITFLAIIVLEFKKKRIKQCSECVKEEEV